MARQRLAEREVIVDSRPKQGRVRIALVIAGLVMGALLISPAGAHVSDNVGHLWKQHIKPLAMKTFYTKKQSNQRFQSRAHLGYAYITSAGVLDMDRSRNVAEVQKQAAGIYCLRPTFVPKSVVASGVRDAGSADGIVETKVSPDSSSCQAIFGEAFNIQVTVVRTSTGTFADHAVMVQLLR